MDKRRSMLNVSVSVFSKVVLLIAALFVRRLLIRHIGNEVNGLNSLYAGIIRMLSVAELGVGSAVVYSMYAPIIQGEKKKVAALYCLYRRLYHIIGAVIFAAGLAVMPFLPKLIGDYETLSVNVYASFLLSLVSVVLTYMYSAKTSLIEAYKDNYLTTGILTIGRLVCHVLQIITILLWASFTVYLICHIMETLLIWSLTEFAVRRKHGDIIVMHEAVDRKTRAEIIRNSKAMFMHKIGTVLVNAVDSLIISAFIGVVVLGKYSNYTVVAGVISGVITLFFTPLTSVVGHLCAAGNKDRTKRYFDYFYCMNYILGVVFFLGYYAVIDYVVRICFGAGLEMSRAVAFIITLNQFTKYMRNTALLFRNASGAFYYDRWKPVIEGVVNLVLSLFFVKVFPEEYRVVGVIAATIITTLGICDIVDPYVVFRHAFNKKPYGFWIKNYAYIGVFVISLLGLSYLMRGCKNSVAGILVNGSISIGVSMAALGLVAVFDRAFRNEVLAMARKLRENLETGSVKSFL